MEDKVLIIKQIEDGFSEKKISGVMRLEEENGYAVFHLSLINVPYFGGTFYAVLYTEDCNPVFIKLGSRPSSVSQVIEDYKVFSAPTVCGLIYAEKSDCTAVGFAQEENVTTLSAFKKTVKDAFISAVINGDATAEQYNDEVVATENYYELDKDFEKKLDKIERLYFNATNTDSDRYNKEQEESGKDGFTAYRNQDEKYSDYNAEYREDRPYYKRFEKELDGIFSSFIKEESLSAVIPDSEWVKINFKKEKYYVVGQIKEKGSLKYICYGVPSEYRDAPPKELSGLCSFIPKSVFDLNGEGYFIIFQDAITGKCVKKPT
ncbi:MAG: hypothetical protein IJR66_03735 [Clostridia bacterium]|nr:hypothetical protein [Clostridia bacterium]